jgi:hypothetical protein
MNIENIRMLELAAEHLGDLLSEVVFVGGALSSYGSPMRPPRNMIKRERGDLPVQGAGVGALAGELEELSRHPTIESGVEGALAAGPEVLKRLELVVRPRITEIIASRA